MPRGGAGDLYAVTQVVIPPELSERERELYDELARHRQRSIRGGISRRRS